MELVQDLEHRSCEEQLRELRGFSMGQTQGRPFGILQLHERRAQPGGSRPLSTGTR